MFTSPAHLPLPMTCECSVCGTSIFRVTRDERASSLSRISSFAFLTLSTWPMTLTWGSFFDLAPILSFDGQVTVVDVLSITPWKNVSPFWYPLPTENAVLVNVDTVENARCGVQTTAILGQYALIGTWRKDSPRDLLRLRLTFYLNSLLFRLPLTLVCFKTDKEPYHLKVKSLMYPQLAKFNFTYITV